MMRQLAWIGLMLLAGCNEQCPTLPGGSSYCLQAPANSPVYHALQQVTITTPTRSETLLMQIESTPQQLALGGLTPLGQTLFTMQWDGQHTHVSWAPGITPPFDPAALIALIQMAQSPEPLNVDGIAIQRQGKHPPFEQIHIEVPAAELKLDIHNLDEESAR